MLDAATGQNAVNQAREFQSAAGITGIVLTKLDGTPKGGVVLPIMQDLGLPVKFIGVGGAGGRLCSPLTPDAFADALFDVHREEAPVIKEDRAAWEEERREEDAPAGGAGPGGGGGRRRGRGTAGALGGGSLPPWRKPPRRSPSPKRRSAASGPLARKRDEE